jgi:hypothetical protein
MFQSDFYPFEALFPSECDPVWGTASKWMWPSLRYCFHVNVTHSVALPHTWLPETTHTNKSQYSSCPGCSFWRVHISFSLYIFTITFLSKTFRDPWCIAEDASYRPELDCFADDSNGSWVPPATSSSRPYPTLNFRTSHYQIMYGSVSTNGPTKWL